MVTVADKSPLPPFIKGGKFLHLALPRQRRGLSGLRANGDFTCPSTVQPTLRRYPFARRRPGIKWMRHLPLSKRPGTYRQLGRGCGRIQAITGQDGV